MKKWKKIALAVGAVLVLAIVVMISVKASQKGIVTVQTGRVARQDLVSLVTASGEIKPLMYVNIGATAFGRITDIAVKEGDRVKKGQLLAKLEAVQPTADVEAQQAALKATDG